MDFRRLNSAEEVRLVIDFYNSSYLPLVIDIETTSKEPRKARLIDIQLSGTTTDSAVIFDQEFKDELLRIRKDVTLVAHNYKYDAHVLFNHGVNLLDHIWRDTMLIGHLLDENRESYSLDSYVKEYWNDNYKEEFWKENKSYEAASAASSIEYACKDIYYTGRIYKQFERSIIEQEIPYRLVRHVHRLQNALLRTEIEGIRVDQEYLSDLGARTKNRIDELKQEMRSSVKDEIEVIELEMWAKELQKRKTDRGRAGVSKTDFNFDSSQQLSRLLYEGLQLEPQRNEKTKAISTDYSSLERIKEAHPVVRLIQENRDLQKVYGTYVQGTIERIHQGRSYPEFRVWGTVTGRLAHSNPNLAQLPKTGGVRGIYIPDPGNVLISADYSQLEVVIEAHLTKDKNLIRMLENGESKHDLTAKELGCSRDTAKTLNFALQYWASHFKVAKLLGISVQEGKKVWEKYWQIYAGPKKLKAETDRMIDEGIPLQTVFGRKRRFPIRKRQEWDSDYRQAYNFLIQSTGADLTSESFYKVSDVLNKLGLGKGLFTVHDEIIVEVKKEEAALAEVTLVGIMQSMGQEYKLTVPLKAQSSGPMDRWED